MNYRLRSLAIAVMTMAATALVLGACGGSDRPVALIDDNDEDNNDDPNGDDNVDPNGDDNVDPNGDDNNVSSDGDGADGAACSQPDDCANDTCLDSAEWPDGYCSSVHCESNADCEDGDHNSFCLANPQGNDFCARACDPDDSDPCRDQYACLATPDGGADGWCGPEPDDFDPTDNDDNGGNGNGGTDPDDDFDIQCEDVTGFSPEFEYDVDADTTSYMVVPFSPNGELMVPDGISTPGGQYVDFENDYPFMLSGVQLFGILNPTLIPATPEMDYLLESGTHTYHYSTDDSEICYYVVQDSGTSTTLDLNLYLVGLPGVDASNADTDIDIQEMLDEAENILAQSGIELGEIRYFDVPAEAEQEHSIIRSREEVHDLAAYSQDNPGDDASDLISANVFITEQFSMSDGSNAIGISLGIPGAAALHGSGLSGVAMTGEYLGEGFDGNDHSAQTLAHELGHFLGLFHTTEQGNQNIDPLQDTPTCSDLSNPQSCPDWNNLMFPMAGSDGSNLTDDQSYVIGSNPLTY